MRVKLKTKFGQFWDRRIRWGITAGEVKDLPEPLPQDTLTYQKLRMGGFEIVYDDESTVPDAMDAPVVEVTDISAAKDPDPTPPVIGDTADNVDAPTTDVGRTVPDDSHTPSVGDAGITSTTDRPAETPIPPAPISAPKKRGRPKKAK